MQFSTQTLVNPLKSRGVNWLHFVIRGLTYILISDIRALWRSGLSQMSDIKM